MPGRRKWDGYHELFLLAEKQGSGMASSVGTHLSGSLCAPLEWELAWLCVCVWPLSRWQASQSWTPEILSIV